MERHPIFDAIHDEAGNGLSVREGRSHLEADRDHTAEELISAGLDDLGQRIRVSMPPADLEKVMKFLERTRARVDSLICATTRAASAPGIERFEVLRDKTRLSTREAKRMARVADRLSEMPKTSERFAAGDITFDHATALADAAEKVGADVVEADPTLLEEANRTNSDRFTRRARNWSESKLIEAGVDPLERQRRARKANLWVEKDTGLGILFAKLPRPQFEHLRQVIDGHYLHLLRRDGAGGRDAAEVRTAQQRLADAVFELLTNRDAGSGEPLPSGDGRIRAKASTQLILTAPIGTVDGTAPGGRVEVMGVGPVPRHVLGTLTPDTELAAMLFDRAGRPLWLGRNQRLANAAQRLAVAVRDGGCFECGAPMHRCELHHIRAWGRDRGPTDIDNLVAVCRRHHRQLETGMLTVRHAPNGRYGTYLGGVPPP